MNYKMWEMQADYVIRQREHMRYIGVFALDGDLIAHAGAPGVQQFVCAGTGASNTADTVRVLNIKIEQKQAKAVVTHMKNSNIGVARINIASLHFLCFRHGTGNMVGMSNFNIENSEKAIQEMDKAYFRISRRHFTRSDSLDSHHVVNIAATMWKDVVIIGIGLPGKSSCLSAVQELRIIDPPPDVEKPLNNAMASIVKRTDKHVITDKNIFPDDQKEQSLLHLDKEPVAGNKSIWRESDNKNWNYSETMPRMRTQENVEKDAWFERMQGNFRRTKSVDDAIEMHDDIKHDFEEERVKSATIRSIEALRNIGPFTGSISVSESGSENMLRSKSTELLIEKKKRKPPKKSKSVSSVDAGSRLNRRPSRVTMV